MAVYAITHRCGHVQNRNRPGRYSENKRNTLAWVFRTHRCTECLRPPNWRRDVAAAIDWGAEAGLPPLRGSKKQLIWAQQIRGEFGPKIIALRERFKDTDVVEDPAVGDLLMAADYALGIADAGWWIETGYDPVSRQNVPVWYFASRALSGALWRNDDYDLVDYKCEQLRLLLEELGQDP